MFKLRIKWGFCHELNFVIRLFRKHGEGTLTACGRRQGGREKRPALDRRQTRWRGYLSALVVSVMKYYNCSGKTEMYNDALPLPVCLERNPTSSVKRPHPIISPREKRNTNEGRQNQGIEGVRISGEPKIRKMIKLCQ